MTTTLVFSEEPRWSRGDHDDLIARRFTEEGLHRQAQEVFAVFPIREDGMTCGPIEINRGTFGYVDVDIPSVIAAVITAGCSRFSVVHNHPTGGPVPSDDDRRLVGKILNAARVMRMTLETSIIVTRLGETHFDRVNAQVIQMEMRRRYG